ncbi:hypothetical protein Tco_0903367 [Tanacetum coccineum]
MTFSNPLFDSNDDFTSSDDESLSDEDVPEDNVKIYSNPLFEFDDEYISSDVNPLFDKMLEDIKNKDSYVSDLDKPALLVTPIFYANKDECFDPGGDVDEIKLLLHHNTSTPNTHTPEPSRHFDFTCDDDDDDEEYSIPLKEMPQISSSIALVPVSSIMEPEDSLTMGDEHLSTIPEKEIGRIIKDIECKVSYYSNLDESTFLVTPLSDSNEDEFFTPRENVELLLHHDPSIRVISILEGFIDEPPLKENDNLFYLESKENNWKKILYNAPIDDLITEDKVFDPEIYKKSFSLTFVKLTFEDRHYFPITFVIRIFLPYLTYSVDSSFLLSSGSEDTIFDPVISTFHFSFLKPVAYENPMVIFPFFCFCPKDKGIRGESS